MNKWAGWVGMFVGSSIFGWIGAQVGIMTGFILGTIGAGLGLYFGRKWLSDFLD